MCVCVCVCVCCTPAVTLLSSQPEIQFVALRNINLIVQKRYVFCTKGKRKEKKKKMENPGIDPGTSRMLSERSTK